MFKDAVPISIIIVQVTDVNMSKTNVLTHSWLVIICTGTNRYNKCRIHTNIINGQSKPKCSRSDIRSRLTVCISVSISVKFKKNQKNTDFWYKRTKSDLY